MEYNLNKGEYSLENGKANRNMVWPFNNNGSDVFKNLLTGEFEKFRNVPLLLSPLTHFVPCVSSYQPLSFFPSRAI